MKWLSMWWIKTVSVSEKKKKKKKKKKEEEEKNKKKNNKKKKTLLYKFPVNIVDLLFSYIIGIKVKSECRTSERVTLLSSPA